MKRLLLLLTLYLITLSLFSMTKVTGVVRDSLDKPISDVWVNSDIEDVKTGFDGSFQIKVSDRHVTLSFHKMGYKKASFTIINLKTPIVIILKIEPFSISGVHVWDRSMYSSSINLNESKKYSIPPNSYSNIAGILAHQGSFLVQGTSLDGEKQSLSLLGFKSRHVAVSLDGVPLNVSGEDFDLSSIPSESVERVEVMQNNTSSLVGSGGMGGMLNIHTKQFGNNGKSTLEATYGSGSLGYQRESFRSFLTTSHVQAMVYYSNMKAENDFSYHTMTQNGQNVTLKRTFNRKYVEDMMFHLGLMKDDWNVHYTFDYQDFDKQLPGPVNFLLLYQDAGIKGETLRQSLDIRHGKENNELHLMLYQNRENTTYDNTHAPLPVYLMKSKNKLVKNGSQGSWDKVWMEMKFHTFLEYWKEDYIYEEPTYPSHDIPQKSQTLFAGGEQIEYSKDISSFTFHSLLNGRIDHQDLFDRFVTYRISADATYRSWSDVTAGGSYGTGFTVPSFYSLYWKGDAQATGNADLEPERSHGWQVFGKWQWQDNSLQINYHQNYLEDMILWIQSYTWGGVWKPVNIARAEMKSIVFEATAKPFSFLNLDASFTYTSAYDRSILPNGVHSAFYGKHLVYLPETQFRCSAAVKRKSQFLNLYYSYTGRQWSKPDNLLPPLKPYGIVDADTGMNFVTKKWKESLSLSAYNLFNHKYEIYPYIPQPGFHWQLQLNIAYQL